MEIFDTVSSVILNIFWVLNSFLLLYTVMGFLMKAKKYPETDKRFRYAVVISARNEEKVIGNLIDSIRKQTYSVPADIFVIADNCTDNTAEICREKGAEVVVRSNAQKQRKGYALQYFFNAKRDAGTILDYDGYFIFDADNLLAPDFIEQMNKAFARGADIVTSYRNTKNFDTNFISASYGIHFYNNTVTKHRPRSILGTSTHLTGTGHLIKSELLKEGWSFTTFTEDDELTLTSVAKGCKILYCEEAEFYDEQPYDFRTVCRQRVRWARGRLVNFFRLGGRELKAIFTGGGFAAYDMFINYFPFALFNLVLTTVYPLSVFLTCVLSGSGYDYAGTLCNILSAGAVQYLYILISGVFTVIRERRHIRCSVPKLILYTITFPWFDMIGIFFTLAALFVKVRWKPIKHDDSRKIDDIMNIKTL